MHDLTEHMDCGDVEERSPGEEHGHARHGELDVVQHLHVWLVQVSEGSHGDRRALRVKGYL